MKAHETGSCNLTQTYLAALIDEGNFRRIGRNNGNVSDVTIYFNGDTVTLVRGEADSWSVAMISRWGNIEHPQGNVIGQDACERLNLTLGL